MVYRPDREGARVFGTLVEFMKDGPLRQALAAMEKVDADLARTAESVAEWLTAGEGADVIALAGVRVTLSMAGFPAIGSNGTKSRNRWACRPCRR